MIDSRQYAVGGYSQRGLMACPSCDGVHRLTGLASGGKALCARCGALLFRHLPKSLDRATALYVAALVLFLLANMLPFLSLKLGGRIEQSRLISGSFEMYRAGMPEMGLLVLLTSVVFPFITICGMIYVLLPLRLGISVPWIMPVWRVVRAISPWSLMGVFMLGLLVSVLKLQEMAVIIPGFGFFAFIGLLLVSSAAAANFDPGTIWPRVGPDELKVPIGQGCTAAESGYVSCPACLILMPGPTPGSSAGCPRCGSVVHGIRHAHSLSRSCAYLITASILLVPAYLLPVMTLIRFGQKENSTIFAGVLHLIQDGAWPLGLLVFFASILVPLTKITAMFFLLIMVHLRSDWRLRDRTVLYRLTEAVGAWSMVDIYLISILIALLRMDELATIFPGAGATFFGAAVVMTMMAAHSFDPRLMWDRGIRYD